MHFIFSKKMHVKVSEITDFFIYLFLRPVILFYCSSGTVVSIFPPPLPPACLTLLRSLDPTPLWLCPCVLYMCSLMTPPLLSHITPVHPPSSLVTVSSQIVLQKKTGLNYLATNFQNVLINLIAKSFSLTFLTVLIF